MKKKSKPLAFDDDDEDWELDDEEEIDDIIDDDDEELDEEEEESPRRKRRSAANFKKVKKPKKKGGPVVTTFKWAARVLIVFGVVLLLFLPGSGMDDVRDDIGLETLKNLVRPFRRFPEWTNVSMRVNYDLVIQGGKAQEVTLKVAPPFDIRGNQSSDFIIQDVYEVDLVRQPDGPTYDFNTDKNTMTYWQIINDRGQFNFSATYSLKLYTYQWDITEEDSGTVDQIPMDYKMRYLDDEWMVRDSEGNHIDHNQDGYLDFRYHPSHPDINRTAHEIVDGETNVVGMISSIYDWIQENLHYPDEEERDRDINIYGEWPKYPTGCMADGFGDCDDQSLLMASLCRAVGIPAWLEIGYLYDPVYRSWGGHGWFNVAIPVKTDQGIQIIRAPIDPVNKEFLFRDPYRITDWIDTGLPITVDGETMFNLDYYYNYYSDRKSNYVSVEKSVTYESLM
ncbi:MAG: transglutaminase-like domain-containing protein, partial [Thermoplasmatota archaeon]